MTNLQEQFERKVCLLTVEYVRKTSVLNSSSTPEDFARCYHSAFDRIADELLRLDKQKPHNEVR